VSQITLPNGGSYKFYYGSDNPHPGYTNPYGLLSEIDYPDGGWVRYTWKLSDTNSELEAYSDADLNLDGCLYQYKTPVVATRQVGFGGSAPSLTQTFAYSTTWNTSPADPAIWTNKNTTVCTTDDVRGSSVCTNPASVPANAFLTAYGYTPTGTSVNNMFVHESYPPELPLESTIATYDWGSTTSVAKTVTKTWYNQFALKSQTTAIGGISSLITYTYGAFQQPVETDEYDYGATTPSRKTINTYQSLPKTSANQTGFPNSIGLLYDKRCKTVVTDGNNNPVSETDLYYDGGTALCGTVPAPSVTGVSGLVSGTHDETNYGPGSSEARGNVTRMVRWLNGGTSPATTYTYDETGQVLTMTDSCGIGTCSDMTGTNHTTTYSYADNYSSGTPPGNTNAYLTKVTNPLGQSIRFAYGYSDGQLTTSTDPNNQTTTYQYNIQPSGCNFLDKLDRLGEIDYPDSGKTTFCYNDAAYNQSTPSPSVTTTKVIASGVNEVSVAAFDGIGHQVESILSSDPDGPTTSVTAYDGTGKPYQSYNPTRCGPPTTNCGETTWGVTTYTYDALGRTTQVAEPDGSTVSSSYSANTTTTPPGYLTTVTDEVGNQRNSQTDGLGRLTYVWEAPTTSGYETDYTYDTLSNLLSVKQKGGSANSSNWRTRSFVYDSLSRLTSAANPESGTTSYSYDANGNLAQKTSPKPSQSNSAVTTKLNFCYDNLNRETSKSYNAATCPATSPQATYTYDQGTNAIGHRTGMTDPPGSASWTYDAMGRVASETRVTSNVTKTTSYLYNKDGSVQSITYPSTRAVNYTYGGAGRALSVIDSSGPISYVTSATYAPQGGLSTYTNGFVSGGFTGITNADTYSNRLQPVLISATSPSASIFSLCYDFHLKVTVSSPPCPTFNASTVGDNGNVYQIVNNRDGNRTQNFVYDPLNRISQASTSGPNWGEIYTIDPWGNLTNIGPVTGKANSEQLNVAPAGVNNQLPGFGYDAAGNITSNGILGYTYDTESHLTKFVDNTSDIYIYDGDGQRVKKNAPGVTLYWYGVTGNVLDETGSTGTLVSEYIVFNGKRIARRDADNTVKFYFSDNLGSASVITNNQGAMPPLAESDYYPYGAEIVITSGDSNHYKFTGKERDSESGLDNFGARYYGSSMGRFMSPDWAARPTAVPYAVYGDPQSLNLYTYVRNNTLNRSDPDGHNSEFPAGCQTDDDKCVNRNTQEARHTAQNTRTVSTTSVIGTTTDDLGNRTTVTQTTTATFSTAKNHEGEFLGATTQTAVHSGGAAGDVIAQSGQVSISQKEAVQGMGARAFTDAQQSARPSFAAQFGRVTAQDFRAHPGKYAFAAVEVLAIFTPLPETLAAIEGIHEVKASIDAGVAAGDLSWELTGK
jgi:RHS repeat-associated protein